MTEWQGMNAKSTPVYPDASMAAFAQNQRYKISRELQRRPGLAASSLPKLSGPIRALWPGADFGNYAITQVGGTLTGERNPAVTWAEVKLVPPTVINGTAQAPTILSVDPAPATGTAYPVASVTWTITVQYDGLSGALTYNYLGSAFNVYPNAPPTWVGGAGTTFTYTFGALCLPGSYSMAANIGTITTALNGFSTPIPGVSYLVA